MHPNGGLLSIIIGTYNEAKNISILIPKITEVLKRNKIPYEIIVVDDNSPDGTAEVVRNLAKKDKNLKLVLRKNEKGLATAILTGLASSSGRYLAQMDADLCHDPKHLPQMLNIIKQDRADIVVGSRYLPGSHFLDKSPFRKLVSMTAQSLAGMLLNIKVRDTTNNFRMFKREVYEKIKPNLTSKGNVILLEFLYLAKKSGYRIKEIPIHYVERKFGKTKLKVSKETYHFIKTLLKLVLKYA